ncbi:hypothetical protein AVEN_127803-1 [Araneus ventricosus]|uniref:Uncharacterized protein n=1 Tax=Araneus ventricosus TaxID=182803 RepID=A0A4Y2DNJ6_ARAVE|nr:hypothetical protein AVEN_127803-1 [Araneus ventricosus]
MTNFHLVYDKLIINLIETLNHFHCWKFGCRRGLVVKSRLRSRWIPGPNPTPPKIHRVCEPPGRQTIHRRQTPSPSWCGAKKYSHWPGQPKKDARPEENQRGTEACRGESQLRCRPLHLTTVQKYEVHPKIAPVLLKKPNAYITKLNPPANYFTYTYVHYTTS